ncbi:MAG: 5-dehydro-2-deoxygluconokinase [Alphaproteobacteria bacterium]|nr:5-dehydro-2-deoxygluconokinase [Alphaproteobacteria bacterium]
MGRSCIDLYAHQMGVPITRVTSFDAYVGGCPTNVSVGSRRLGLRVALLTAVGGDQVGDFVLDFLAREGIDTSCSPRFPDRRTSAAIVTIQPPDQFPLTLYRDNCADLAISTDDVRRAPIAQSRVLFVTGTALSGDPSRTATIVAAETARQVGTTVVADIDYRAGIWPSLAEFGANVRTLVRHADVTLGTAEEVRAAAGECSDEAAAERLLATGCPVLIVKRGAEGALLWQRGAAPVPIAPYPVSVVNVLGAGDAFASGFIYGFLQGWSPARAARMGNATGAIIVTRHGCANFMPTLPEVDAFLAQQPAAIDNPHDSLV